MKMRERVSKRKMLKNRIYTEREKNWKLMKKVVQIWQYLPKIAAAERERDSQKDTKADKRENYRSVNTGI